jgi:hypothetical protein
VARSPSPRNVGAKRRRRSRRGIELEKDAEATGTLLSNRCVTYIHLREFDKGASSSSLFLLRSFSDRSLVLTAIADANLVVKKRPEWSKGYVRCAEAYSRTQNFSEAKVYCALFVSLPLSFSPLTSGMQTSVLSVVLRTSKSRIATRQL